MSTPVIAYREVIEKLPEDSTLSLHNVSWEEYEALLASVGEAKGLRISYDQGTLKVMTPSSEHESCTRLLERLVDRLSAKLHIPILFFGSSTMKKRESAKGSEPDACFYVQSAPVIGDKIHLDFGSDPPPDIVVEIDLHHESLAKFPAYAALGVPEIWRYDGQAFLIYYLNQDQYVATESSPGLPRLTSAALTEFLNLGRHKSQDKVLRVFDEWLDRLS